MHGATTKISFDVLRTVYSWTGLPEDGVSRHRNGSERKYVLFSIHNVVHKFWLINSSMNILYSTYGIKTSGYCFTCTRVSKHVFIYVYCTYSYICVSEAVCG
jgi:hypothetical protein